MIVFLSVVAFCDAHILRLGVNDRGLEPAGCFVLQQAENLGIQLLLPLGPQTPLIWRSSFPPLA